MLEKEVNGDGNYDYDPCANLRNRNHKQKMCLLLIQTLLQSKRNKKKVMQVQWVLSHNPRKSVRMLSHKLKINKDWAIFVTPILRSVPNDAFDNGFQQL